MHQLNLLLVIGQTDAHYRRLDCLCMGAQGLDKFNIEKDIAQFIKKEFDKKHQPTWHCIVGRNFGEKHDSASMMCVAARTSPKQTHSM
jgi:Dynein light chain type 1